MKWISVENDRMPNHDRAVLVCNINNEEAPICLGIQVPGGCREFHIIEINQRSKDVTHWMELPKLPKKL
jgi:hypothetical protein